MAKYGSADVAFFLIDGYNVLGDTMEIDVLDQDAMFEDTTCLGDSWGESLPVGLRKAELTQKAFWDDGAGTINAIVTGNEATLRTVTIGLTSSKSVSFQGAYQAKVLRKVDRGKIHKIDIKHTITGSMDDGATLQALATKTADWDTSASPVDNGASSNTGAAAYQHVGTFSGFTGFIGKIRHSADNVTYADLVTFTNVTAANSSERKTVTSGTTINRYTYFQGDVTGTGSMTIASSFSRT